MRKLTAIFLLCSFIVGCGQGDGKTSIRSAEFTSIASCVAGIKRDSGLNLQISRDTPDVVSGTLTNGKTFRCEKNESGSKGIYYEGWYEVAQ